MKLQIEDSNLFIDLTQTEVSVDTVTVKFLNIDDVEFTATIDLFGATVISSGGDYEDDDNDLSSVLQSKANLNSVSSALENAKSKPDSATSLSSVLQSRVKPETPAQKLEKALKGANVPKY